MRRLILLAVAVTITGCASGFDPNQCHWNYTAYKAYGAIDSVGHVTITSKLVPVDSQYVCVSKTLAQG